MTRYCLVLAPDDPAMQTGYALRMSVARRDRSDWMTRKLPSNADDGSFDREFWARQSPEQRFEAAWQCVLDYAAMKGISEPELRLQRSVVRVERR